MWPWALGSAALGGLAAYQQSGGDLGKTLAGATIGGGLGYFVPGASRMAGQALADRGLLTSAAGATTSALNKLGLAGKFGLPAAVTEQAVRSGAGQLGRVALGTMAIPAVAAGAAGIPGQVMGGAATAAALTGVPGFGSGRPGGLNPVAAVPPELQALLGANEFADMANPMGKMAAARYNSKLEADLQRDNAMKTFDAQYPRLTQVQKDNMARQMAAAQIRSNIAINQDAILGGLTAARTMGINAATQMGDALTKQYNFG
jgi:hypothetical protein